MRHFAVGSLAFFSLLLNGCAMAQKASPSAVAAPAELNAQTPPPASPNVTGESASIAAAPAQRQMIYSATLQIVVPDTTIALDAIVKNAKSLGGYLQQMDEASITVRVPAARLGEAMAAVEKLGQVTQRSVQGQDITEEMHDLQIRLDTALQVRQRLLALLDKADKTADAIKVEEELERVVLMIEQLKGKIRFYESQVAMSTLAVKLNSPAPQQTMEQRVPFAWVRELGDGLVGTTSPRSPQKDASHGIRFELPKSYIRYYGEDEVAEAMSGQEVYIRVQRQDNYKGGDLGFWSVLSHRVLVESRCIVLDKESEVILRTGATAHLFTGTRQVAGKPYGYLLALVVRKHEVYAFEAWGPAEQVVADRAALVKSVQSIDVEP